MNKNHYRLIFSRIHNQLIAVAETVKSRGKQSTKSSGHKLSLKAKKTLRLGIISASLFLVLANQSIGAGITPASNAGTRPIMDAAQNSVPIINIAPPSKGGVSRNQYQDLNVDKHGVIFNNSNSQVNTQLGGWINANPQLGVTPARIIVNEVIGTNPSQLNGAMEIAGPRAGLVIANPNGINCDGCSAINANRFTLSTGHTNYDAAGNLTSFDINQGLITIGQNGLSATDLAQLDLLARGIILEGEVWAQKLNLIAGANQVAYAVLSRNSISATSNSPSFAVDIKALGGLYANEVYLIATDKGLGVNSTGRIAALAGDLQLSVNGDLTSKDLYAKQNINLTVAGKSNLNGQSQADGALNLISQNKLNNSGSISAQTGINLQASAIQNTGSISNYGSNTLTLNSSGNLQNSGAIASVGELNLAALNISDNAGTITSQSSLNLTANSLNLQSTAIAANGDVILTAKTGDINTSSTIQAGAGLTLNASGELINSGSIFATSDANLNAKNISDNSGTITSAANLSLNANSLDLSKSSIAANGIINLNAKSGDVNSSAYIQSGGDLNLNSSGNLINSGTLSASENLKLSAKTISDTGGTITSVNNLQLSANSLDLNNSNIIANGDIALNANSGAINTSASIQSGGKINLTSSANLSNSGSIAANDSVNLYALNINDNAGTITSAKDLTLKANQLDLQHSTIAANGELNLLAKTGAINTSATIQSAANLTLTANTSLINAGLISAEAELNLAAETISDNSGTITSAKDLSISANSLTLNNSTIAANGDVTLRAKAGDINTSATIQSGANLSLNSRDALNNSGSIMALESLSLSSLSFTDNSGTLTSAKDLSISANSLALNNSTIAANGDVKLSANAGDINTSATIQSGANLSLSSNANLNNSGSIAGTTEVNLTALKIIDTAGSISSVNKLQISADSLVLNNSIIAANGDLALNAKAGDIASSASIQSGGDLSLTSSGYISSSAKILSSGVIKLQANSLTNSNIIQANNTLNISSNALDNTAGQLLSGTGSEINATQVNNKNGTIASNSKLTVNSTNLNNQTGSISAADIKLITGDLDNSNSGQIIGANTLELQINSINNASGTIASGSDLSLDSAQTALNNAGGKIVAQHDLTLNNAATYNQSGTLAAIKGKLTLNTNAGEFNNSSGQLQASGDLSLNTGSVNNASGLISGNDLSIQSAVFTNQAGQIIAGGKLSSNSQALNNDAGLIQAVGNLSLNTNNQQLANQNSANKGIIAGGDLHIDSGAINNQSGFIAAQNRQTINANGDINNSQGQIVSNADNKINATNINNNNGKIDSLGILNLTVKQQIYNQNGVISSALDSTLTADKINNANGQIGAKNLNINADNLNNNAGAIIGNANANITVNRLDNSNGQLGAIGTLNVSAKSLINDNASIIANGGVTISSSANHLAGSIASQKDVTLNIDGDYSNSGTLSANGNLTINSNNLDNSGSLLAGNTFTSNTGNLNNSGEISAGTSKINASGTLNNSGLIDAGDTRLDANIINNNGRIYGDYLSLGAASINNSSSAVIAARQDLQIGANRLKNVDGGELYSLGDMNIGGALDENGFAINRMNSLINDSAKIEAAGNLSIASNSIENKDTHLQTAVVVDSVENIGIVTPTGGGWSTNLPISSFILDDSSVTQYYVAADGTKISFENDDEYLYTKKTSHTVVTQSAAAQILSGGDLSLSGSVNNFDSQIVAGATLNVVGATINNQASTGTEYVDVLNPQHYVRSVADNCGYHKNCAPKHRLVSGYHPVSSSSDFSLNTIVVQSNSNQTTNQAITGSSDKPVDKKSDSAKVATGVAINVDAASVNAKVDANGKPIAGNTQPDINTPSIAGISNPNINTKPRVINTQTVNGGDEVIFTLPKQNVPNNQLFPLHPEPSAQYLVETDPRFTNRQNFLSSDYMIAALQRDPSQMLKRYGDGFFEQQQVNDQILALTGRRFISGYADTQDEYQALMNAGVSFAEDFQLTPGVALSAAQMANLTSDIVWLVKQSVTLPDGSTQEVLVPQVYLRQAKNGDLYGSGALMAGSDVIMATTDTLTNSGRIQGNNIALSAGTDLINQHGIISGQNIYARANNDLKNLSGQIFGTGDDSQISLSAGRDIVLQTEVVHSSNGSNYRDTVGHTAIVQAGAIQIDAAHDLLAIGALVNAKHDLLASAGNAINISSVVGKYKLDSGTGSNHQLHEGYTQNHSSNFTAGNDLVLAANQDVNINGSDVNAGHDAQIQGRNVTISAAIDDKYHDISSRDANSSSRTMRNDESAIGANINATNNLNLVANGGDGNGNINLNGAYVNSDNEQVSLLANNDVNIKDIHTNHSSIDEAASSGGGIFSHHSSSMSDHIAYSQSQGSEISGDKVFISAGKNSIEGNKGNINIIASNVVGTHDVLLHANNDINIAAGVDTRQEQYSQSQSSSGFSSKGLSISYSKQQSADNLNDNDTTSSQERSLVGSTAGNVKIVAANNASIIGSDVSALAGDIGIQAKNIAIVESQDDLQSQQQHQDKQSSFGMRIAHTAKDNYQNLKDEAAKGKGVEMARMRKIAHELFAAQLASIPGVTFDYSKSNNQSSSNSEDIYANASGINAGGNISLIATGDNSLDANGKASSGDILIAGSNVTSSGGLVNISAARDVNIGTSTSNSYSSTQATNNSHGLTFGLTQIGDAIRSMNGGANHNGDALLPYFHSNKQFASNETSSEQTASLISGSQVSISSQTGDINISGSAINGDMGVDLQALNGNINIASGEHSNDYQQDGKGLLVGALGGGSGSTTIGAQHSHEVIHNHSNIQGDLASQISSSSGDINLLAKDTLHISGAKISAANDINMQAGEVLIDPSFDIYKHEAANQSRQAGITLSASSVISAAADAIENLQTTSKKSKDQRIQALAAGTAALTAYNAYQAYSGSNGSSFLTISVTGGASHSRDEEKSSRKISNGSEISAGNDLNIVATGKGKASNIDIIGSNISAGNNINLSADNKINLIAASDDSSQNSKHSGNSWGVGVAATIGDGISFGITANASASAGYINGNSTSWQYSHANAGNQVNIYSGGDTNLIGGIISGQQVNADIGGDLNIESLQDLSKYKSQDLSAGGSVTIGYGFSASGSASFANINNDYASVQEQAGIKAGDGGFNIKVKGNTDLKGAVIESSQSAIDQHKNRLETNSLSYSDIANHAVSKGGSVGVAGGYTSSDYSQVNSDGSRSNNSSTINANGEHKTSNSSGENVNTPVVMASSDSDSSSTKSGISGGELIIKDGSSSDIKRDISSETEQSGAINNNLDVDKIQAGFAVTKQLVEQIGVFEANKAAEADAAKKALKAADEDPNTDPNSAEYQQLKANVEQADKWQPGGEYGRVISAFSAAATGNVTGGSAQLIQAAAVNYLQTWAVTGAKDFVDDQLEKDGKTTTGEAVRTALQGLVACAGASANSQNCSAAATGAASGVVINNLIDYANNVDGENLSAAEKQSRKNLVNSLIAGIATAANNPQTATTATGAADMEMVNNEFAKGTTQRIKDAANHINAALYKQKGTATRADVLAQLKYLDDFANQGHLSFTETLNYHSLYLTVLSYAVTYKLMSTDEITSSEDFLRLAVLSMAASGSRNAVAGKSFSAATAADEEAAQLESYIISSTINGKVTSKPLPNDEVVSGEATVINSGGVKGLTASELSSIKNYTGNGYIHINKSLRTGNVGRVEDTVNNINNGLDKMAQDGYAYNGTVYRGTYLSQSQIDEIITTGKYSDAGYTSTTVNKDIAFPGNVEFKMQGTKSGVDISSLSKFEDEKEIIFKPNTEFEVIKAGKNTLTGKWEIILKEKGL